MRARWVAIVTMGMFGVTASGVLAQEQSRGQVFAEPLVAVLMIDESSPVLRIALAADAQACREVGSIEAAPSPGTAVVVMAMTIAAIVRGRRSL